MSQSYLNLRGQETEPDLWVTYIFSCIILILESGKYSFSFQAAFLSWAPPMHGFWGLKSEDAEECTSITCHLGDPRHVA